MAPRKNLGVVKDTRADAAKDRGNIPLPRFACFRTLGDKSDYEYGEEELRVQKHEA